jgi:hypothetical protein
MNERIKKLKEQATSYTWNGNDVNEELDEEKFVELIVEECRNVVSDVYRNTPLELCGPLLTVDEEIANHFYGVTEDD